ncbi:TRAP transporter small permease [Paracoccus fistulariae]|uniref:TRAP transporter small permease protein n=1 Tax=Paracoccus fistulariae TaxID=658446 RepID=A0ABY7SLU6_9RHOB|nr:TRAP transporter small permease [Paracoccus fistulariae]MDB6179877.1 TRAP transporter small permease [Paracoccus fistulariae]WCR07980.1 TRAP transporter small permease [Paracoccus fistulariae]
MADADMMTEHGKAVPVPGWLYKLCGLFAGIGGVTLLALMLMTVASVTLRAVIGKPIPGDYEMVELCSAIAIFCFLPWCQVNAGNVLVDFFTQKTSARTNHLLEAVGDLLYLLIAALLLWRMIHGASEMRSYAEQTMVLRLPVWTSFIVILPATALLVATCTATMMGHLRMART